MNPSRVKVAIAPESSSSDGIVFAGRIDLDAPVNSDPRSILGHGAVACAGVLGAFLAGVDDREAKSHFEADYRRFQRVSPLLGEPTNEAMHGELREFALIASRIVFENEGAIKRLASQLRDREEVGCDSIRAALVG